MTCRPDCNSPYAIRAVNAQGTANDQDAYGFWSRLFWIQPSATSSSSSISTTTAISTSTSAPLPTASQETQDDANDTAIGVGVGVGVGVSLLLLAAAFFWRRHHNKKRRRECLATYTDSNSPNDHSLAFISPVIKEESPRPHEMEVRNRPVEISATQTEPYELPGQRSAEMGS